MKEDLLRIMTGIKYSLLADESTDVATQTNLCLVMKYYSKEHNRVPTHLLP